MHDAHHTIKAVAQRTGLSAHVIRIWEKRYSAVEPVRTDTNRRLYSDREVERLTLLRDLTQSGHSIGPIAQLPTERLRQLASDSLAANGKPPEPARAPSGSLLDQSLAAVKELDGARLEKILNQSAVELGAQGVLQKVIAPLAQRIGDLWRDGIITAAHEHFASGIIRIFLGHAAKSFAHATNAPTLVVGTPHGQIHELGALLAGAAAAHLGWRVVYLGASLPAAEIAGAARQSKALAVALSLVYPEDDPDLPAELGRLRQLLPEPIVLLAGGRAAASYRPTLTQIGATEMKDLQHFCSVLDEIRKPRRK